LTLSKDEIKTTLGIKSDAKLEETLSVATKIPSLKLIKAEFKVPGEVVVTPASNSYLSVKFLVRSAKHHGVSKVSLDKLKEVDTMETLRNPYKIVSDQPLLPISYSSYLPVLRRSNYIAFVVLQKDGRIAEAPAVFQNLDLSNLELTQEEYTDGEKVKIGTFKIPISSPTPSEVGKYQFRVVIKSLDYFTNDIDTTVIMNVEQPPRLEELDEGLYDIPDPDEDSLAGALASMKGEKVRKVEQYESSDDEDEDEEEEEEEDDDFTDINTDTEDEGDN
jgi:translocation protein SEC63